MLLKFIFKHLDIMGLKNMFILSAATGGSSAPLPPTRKLPSSLQDQVFFVFYFLGVQFGIKIHQMSLRANDSSLFFVTLMHNQCSFLLNILQIFQEILTLRSFTSGCFKVWR